MHMKTFAAESSETPRRCSKPSQQHGETREEEEEEEDKITTPPKHLLTRVDARLMNGPLKALMNIQSHHQEHSVAVAMFFLFLG